MNQHIFFIYIKNYNNTIILIKLKNVFNLITRSNFSIHIYIILCTKGYFIILFIQCLSYKSIFVCNTIGRACC